MIEPKAFVEAWNDIKYIIGFSEGRLTLVFQKWFEDLDDYLCDSKDPALCADIDSHLLDPHFNMSGEYFYTPERSGWVFNKTYCENSVNFKGVDVVIDSSHNCSRCISPKQCLKDGRLVTKKFRNGNLVRNIDEIESFFEPFISHSKKFLIIDYIFGKKFNENHSWNKKKAGRLAENLGKQERETKHQWESIPDLVKFILSKNKKTEIEIHTCCEKNKKTDFIQYLTNKIGLGNKIKVHSWHDNSFGSAEEDTPHDRYFLTETSGVSLGSGFDYGKKTTFRMLSHEEVQEEHKNWVKNTSLYKHLWYIDLP